MRTTGVVAIGAAVAIATDNVLTDVTGDFSANGVYQPVQACGPSLNGVCGDDNLIGETMAVFAELSAESNTRDWTTAILGDLFQTSIDGASATACKSTTDGCAYHPWFKGSAGVAQVQPPALVGVNAADGAIYLPCLVQWDLGALPGSEHSFPTVNAVPSSHADSIQECQKACITAGAECDLWSFDVSVGDDHSENCFLQTVGALNATLNAIVSDTVDDCLLSDATNVKWATCASDPSIKICATADGAIISGRQYCDATTTPTLAYLQANAPACVTAITSGSPFVTDDAFPTVVPSRAALAIPIVGAASLVALTVYLF